MNQILNQTSLQSASSWQAELTLGLSRTSRGTVLKRSEHRGPLYVQKPFYPEGRELAHLYLLHPPGGMVSGDDLQIRVNTDSDAHALITTPGAGRVYRARPDRSLQKQRIHLKIAENSSLEWLPLENIIFPDANTQLEMNIELAENSQLIVWDITCFGLPASQQPFDRGEVGQSLQLFQNGRLKLREKLNLNPQQNSLMQSRAGLAGQAVNGLMLAGPFVSEESVSEVIERLREECAEVSALAGVSLNGAFLQVRYLGACSEQARLLFTRCWKHIRPQLLNRRGCEPRIWAT